MTWMVPSSLTRKRKEREAPVLSFCLTSALCPFPISSFRVLSLRFIVYFIPPFCHFVESRLRLNTILFHRYEFAVLSFCRIEA